MKAIHYFQLSLVCLATGSFAGCSQLAETPTARANGQEKPAASAQVARVTTVKPVKKLLKRTSNVPGEILAYEQAPLYARVSGIVDEVRVDLGDKVGKGDVLIQLAAPDLEQDVQARRAQVEVAKAEVLQGEAAVKQAQSAVRVAQSQQKECEAAIVRFAAESERAHSEYSRLSELASRQVVTPKAEDEARSTHKAAEAAQQEAATRCESAAAGIAAAEAKLDSAKAELMTTKSRVQLAEAQLKGAEAMFAYAKIRAPFDGRIATRKADAGHLTHAGSSDSTPLLSIVRSDMVRVGCEISEQDAALGEAGDEAAIRIPALGRTWTGKVTRSAGALDQQTRTLRMEIDLKNDDGVLKPGMYATVALTLAEKADALVLPASAIFTTDGKSQCAVVEAGKIARKDVKIGLQAGAEVEVESGIDAQADVVVKNGAALAVGDKAEILPPEATK